MTATKIGDYPVWIGDLEDAIKWEGEKICVLEVLPEREPEDALWIPILKTVWEQTKLENGEVFGHDYIKYAIQQQLDLVSHLISEHVRKNVPVLVHCGAGQERSPLAVMWWIWRTQGMSMEKAYEYVETHRKETIKHYEWLNKTYSNK